MDWMDLYWFLKAAQWPMAVIICVYIICKTLKEIQCYNEK
jgi:hypothetical protein